MPELTETEIRQQQELCRKILLEALERMENNGIHPVIVTFVLQEIGKCSQDARATYQQFQEDNK